MSSYSTALDYRPSASVAVPQRIAALDFTKGTLVLIMVLYHWINYFIGPQWGFYRYLRFLTPSFIFITGFTISNVYLSKYGVADPRLLKRLVTRGLKLSLIFIALNVARDYILPLLAAGAVATDSLDVRGIQATFVTGNFTSKVVAFYILVPIAYLLILSGILMVPQRVCRYTFHYVCALLFALIALLAWNGARNQILEILAIGMLGTLAGFTRIDIINTMIRHRYLLACGYAVYTLAIAIWNVPYVLEIAGTCLSVTIIYLVGTINVQPRKVSDRIILLGRYSLFGYISQIAILQVLEVGLRHISPRGIALFISFSAAFALTLLSVEVVDHARMRARCIDRVYRVVFN